MLGEIHSGAGEQLVLSWLSTFLFAIPPIRAQTVLPEGKHVLGWRLLIALDGPSEPSIAPQSLAAPQLGRGSSLWEGSRAPCASHCSIPGLQGCAALETHFGWGLEVLSPP